MDYKTRGVTDELPIQHALTGNLAKVVRRCAHSPEVDEPLAC